MPLQDSDWFLVTNADGSASRKIRGDKLLTGIADDWFVLLQDGTTSKSCLVSNLKDKASDGLYMLVNQGSDSFKVKSSTVVSKFSFDPLTESFIEWDASINWSSSSWSSTDGRATLVPVGSRTKLPSRGTVNNVQCIGFAGNNNTNGTKYFSGPLNMPINDEWAVEVWATNHSNRWIAPYFTTHNNNSDESAYTALYQSTDRTIFGHRPYVGLSGYLSPVTVTGFTAEENILNHIYCQYAQNNGTLNIWINGMFRGGISGVRVPGTRTRNLSIGGAWNMDGWPYNNAAIGAGTSKERAGSCSIAKVKFWAGVGSVMPPDNNALVSALYADFRAATGL